MPSTGGILLSSRAAHHQAVVDRYQAERRLPSLAVGVLDGPELVWSGTAGHRTTTETQYRIGSVTKVLTAVLVMQCRDDGLLDLDDELGRLLPECGYPTATVRDVLAHVSGMQSEPVGAWWERAPGGTIEELLAANDGSGSVFEPRDRYHYSNLGYALLGEAVARLRGESWSDLVQSRVLEPLGLTRTTRHPEAPYAEGLSVHHLAGTLTVEPAHDTGAMAPAGQLWSTIEDLAGFAAFLTVGHPGVLPPTTLAEMRQPVPPAIDYGLGIRLVPYAEGTLVGHTGSMPGFQSAVFVDPRRRIGVVALTNATTGFSGPELALALIGDRTPAPAEPWRPTIVVPDWARPLLGYWHWGNSAYELRWHNDRLEWRDLARSAVSEQFAWDGDRIVGTAGYHHGETLHVIRDEDGKIERLECATFLYTRQPYPNGA
ncbi:MAG: serine hydrolase domain-containing protein [Marmoricola sp.]